MLVGSHKNASTCEQMHPPPLPLQRIYTMTPQLQQLIDKGDATNITQENIVS